MSIPLSPQISLSPSSYSSTGATITAAVSLMNRPAYHGKPLINGLTTITPKIVCSRSPSGVIPFHIAVSAQGTTHNVDNAENAYMDLHYEWDFGDSSGTELVTDQWNGQAANANDSQQSPEAVYLYRSAGTYTITLTAKGKDENGDLVTASTSTLLTIGQYYIHLGGATGGTFTLTFEGETTSAIVWNATPAQVIAALHSLTGLDSSNCRSGLLGQIELEGNLAGASYTFTADFAGLSGTVSTPALRTELASSSSASVTVSDLSGLTAQYFDSTYDSGNGAPDGTMDRPYTSFAAIESFLEAGGNRVAYLKRGSSWTMNSRITWSTASHSTIRVLAYGTGSRPVLTQTTTSSNFYWELAYGTSGTANKIMSDYVFSGISFVTQAQLKCFFVSAVGNGTVGYPYSSLHDVVIDDCTWLGDTVSDSGFIQSTVYNTPIYGSAQGGTTSTVTLKSGASSTTDIHVGRKIAVKVSGSYEYVTCTAYNGTSKVATVTPDFSGAPQSGDTYIIYSHTCGSQVRGLHVWRCDIDAASSTQVAIIQSVMGEWHSIFASSIYGGTGSLTYDHHVYMYATGHIIFGRIAFGSGNKNFCVNGNINVLGGPCRHVCFDGNDFTGVQNGFDLSNTDNVWLGTASEDGHFDKSVIQFNRVHSGQISSQQNGFVSYNMRDVTLRYNSFWDNLQVHIALSNTADYPWQPKLWAYGNRFADGAISVRGEQAHYWHNNTFSATTDSSGGNGRCLVFYNTAASVLGSWDCDGNIWNNPGNTNPFYDSAGAADVTFATWQAAGNDVAGSVEDPLWDSPGTGVFVADPTAAVTWPTGFTSLEVSDDGVSWGSYTNSSNHSLGTGIADQATVYFRAVTDSSEANKSVSVSSGSSSADTASEQSSATLTYVSGARTYVLSAGGLFYVIATA